MNAFESMLDELLTHFVQSNAKTDDTSPDLAASIDGSGNLFRRNRAVRHLLDGTRTGDSTIDDLFVGSAAGKMFEEALPMATVNGAWSGELAARDQLSARIFAVVHSWDVTRKDRAYGDALTDDFAVEYLLRHAGQQFCPQVVDAFLRMIESEAPFACVA